MQQSRTETGNESVIPGMIMIRKSKNHQLHGFRINVSRAPDLIPGMVDAILKAEKPLILVRESFTLTTEQALKHILRVQSCDGVKAANDYLKAKRLVPLSL